MRPLDRRRARAGVLLVAAVVVAGGPAARGDEGDGGDHGALPATGLVVALPGGGSRWSVHPLGVGRVQADVLERRAGGAPRLAVSLRRETWVGCEPLFARMSRARVGRWVDAPLYAPRPWYPVAIEAPATGQGASATVCLDAGEDSLVATLEYAGDLRAPDFTGDVGALLAAVAQAALGSPGPPAPSLALGYAYVAAGGEALAHAGAWSAGGVVDAGLLAGSDRQGAVALAAHAVAGYDAEGALFGDASLGAGAPLAIGRGWLMPAGGVGVDRFGAAASGSSGFLLPTDVYLLLDAEARVPVGARLAAAASAGVTFGTMTTEGRATLALHLRRGDGHADWRIAASYAAIGRRAQLVELTVGIAR